MSKAFDLRGGCCRPGSTLAYGGARVVVRRLDSKQGPGVVQTKAKGSPDAADADTQVGAPAQRDCVPTAVRPNKVDIVC